MRTLDELTEKWAEAMAGRGDVITPPERAVVHYGSEDANTEFEALKAELAEAKASNERMEKILLESKHIRCPFCLAEFIQPYRLARMICDGYKLQCPSCKTLMEVALIRPDELAECKARAEKAEKILLMIRNTEKQSHGIWGNHVTDLHPAILSWTENINRYFADLGVALD